LGYVFSAFQSKPRTAALRPILCQLNLATAVATIFASVAIAIFAYSLRYPEIGRPGPAQLDASPISEADYRLSEAGMLLDRCGAQVPFATNVIGYVDQVNFEGARAIFEGWAVDVAAQAPSR
jgi:hypothetical protein